MRIISPFTDDHDPWIRATVPPVGRPPVWSRNPVLHQSLSPDRVGDLACWSWPINHHQRLGAATGRMQLEVIRPPIARPCPSGDSLLLTQGWLVCNGIATPWWVVDETPWAFLAANREPPEPATRVLASRRALLAGAADRESLSAAITEVRKTDRLQRTWLLAPHRKSATQIHPRWSPYDGDDDARRARRISAIAMLAARNWDEIHTAFRAPVVLIVPTDNDRRATVVANPCLRPLGVMKVWKPEHIAQEVLACADRLLLPPDPATVVPTDLSRIVKHGFDLKTSFRRPKRPPPTPGTAS